MRKSSFRLLFAVAVLMCVAPAADAQRARKSVSASEVTGTFRMAFVNKQFKDLFNHLDVLALGGGKLKIAFDLLYPYTLDNENGPRSANLGSLRGEASIVGDTAVFESDEFGPCRITIKFVRRGLVKVTQSGSDADCGFGHNVSAQGIYRKASGRKPEFHPQ